MSGSKFPWHNVKANTMRNVIRDLGIGSANLKTREAMLEAFNLIGQQGIEAYKRDAARDSESVGSESVGSESVGRETHHPGLNDHISTQTMAINEAGGSVSTGEGTLRRSTRKMNSQSMSALKKKTKHASAGVAGPSTTMTSPSLSASTSQVAAGHLTSEVDVEEAVSGGEGSNKDDAEDPPPPYKNESPEPQEGPA
ncbi:hypothetical protein BDZ89DRAFT_1131461 [Hymenopellis radicata]|nr:hypothetical protein BDZ89DRAFT_1131461 [Hymenopellis radicata]